MMKEGWQYNSFNQSLQVEFFHNVLVFTTMRGGVSIKTEVPCNIALGLAGSIQQEYGAKSEVSPKDFQGSQIVHSEGNR